MKIVRNILAIITGIIVGSIVNMGLIKLGPNIIPPPMGVDVTTAEGLQSGIHLMETKHFIFPFLAHALGTLAGAIAAAIVAATKKMVFAMIIGVFFLAGGIGAVAMIPAPLWFNIVDLVFAYLPMAFLGGKIGLKFVKE